VPIVWHWFASDGSFHDGLGRFVCVLRRALLYKSIFFLEQKAVDLESQFEKPLGVLLLCCLAAHRQRAVSQFAAPTMRATGGFASVCALFRRAFAATLEIPLTLPI
jgi:hypothetical protein